MPLKTVIPCSVMKELPGQVVMRKDFRAWQEWSTNCASLSKAGNRQASPPSVSCGCVAGQLHLHKLSLLLHAHQEHQGAVSRMHCDAP